MAAILLCGCADSGSTPGDDGTSTSEGTTTSRGSSDGDPGTSPTGSSATSGADASSSGGDEPSPYDAAGPFAVGVQSRVVAGAGRDIRTTTWYPTEQGGATTALAELYDEPDATTLAALMAAAPPDCVRAEMDATLDAPVAAGSFPIVMFSHCLSCLGVSSSFVAERLASHGIVVVGVTHTDDTLFDQQEGNVADLSARWLQVRSQDVRMAFDAAIADGPVAAVVDPRRAGVFGHSYGAATTGKVLADDDRFVAGVALAAPVQNPLLPGVMTADIAEPMLLLLAQEDNSILEIGNNFIRDNAAALPGGSWLVEVADAGHWSVSDLCGVIDAFAPGCGEGTRQGGGEPFTYIPAQAGRQIAATYVTTFFALHLLGDAAAEDDLLVAAPPELVTVTRFAPM